VNAAASRYLDDPALRCVLVGPARVREALARADVLPAAPWVEPEAAVSGEVTR